jgi:hypothetical protein
MNIEEINEKVLRKNELTLVEKEELVQAMCDNPEAREILMCGALALGNINLAIDLMFYNSKTEENAV